MQGEREAFEARGASLVAIGQGTGRQAAGFAKEWGVTFPILGDEERRAYRAFGMRRGNWWTVALRSMVTAPLESARLMAQADWKAAALPASDVLLLPGVAVVAQGGTLRFLQKAREPSDFPSNAEMFEALAAL